MNKLTSQVVSDCRKYFCYQNYERFRQVLKTIPLHRTPLEYSI